MITDEQLSELKTGLFAGHYNLLLGTGTSLDSQQQNGTPVTSASALTKILAELHGLPTDTPLARTALVLTDQEREEHLTQRYLGCRPGETVRLLTDFVWKTVFTFNIDDALEGAYSRETERAQSCESINFDAQYRTPVNQSQVQIVHLHGFARDSAAGYVFSTSEYGRVTRGQSPWMHVLSELVASEPFIVAGTSLNEPDLEYYLSGRTASSPRKNRGPSFLIEPFPNAITEELCRRHSLVLVKATLKDFVVWLRDKLGKPLSVAQLTLPSKSDLFSPAPAKLDQIAFFSTFELVKPITAMEEDASLSPFFYGGVPSWRDLASAVDVPTNDELKLGAKIRNFVEAPPASRLLMMLSGDPGSGKSTCARRISYNLAREGKIVLAFIGRSAVDLGTLVGCLSALSKPFVLLIDDAADRAVLIRGLVEAKEIKTPFVVLAVDRDYRQDHMDRLLGDLGIEHVSLGQWHFEALVQMIEKYRKLGLVGTADALKRPAEFAKELVRDPVAIAACRILNDFRPMEEIVKSVWTDSGKPAQTSYLVAALTYHCHPAGLQYTILQRANQNDTLNDQFDFYCPLPLTFAHDDDNYVVPLNTVMADRILNMLSRNDAPVLLDAFVKLSRAISPYVNRQSAINRTSEALIAGRLFNAEKIVRPLLGEQASKFYEITQPEWQWNSRYWEHRALLTQYTDLDTAIQYARHAVAIEQHPFPWTTLASILTKRMVQKPEARDSLYAEIYELLGKTFKYEAGRMWRASPHPYWALVAATQRFLDSGGYLSRSQRDFVLNLSEKALLLFRRDPLFAQAVEKMRKQIS